jgi:hypothetical protein
MNDNNESEGKMIDLAENGGIVKVLEPANLREWIQTEQNFWSWLSQAPVARENQVQRLGNWFAQRFSTLNGHVDQWEQNKDNSDVARSVLKEVRAAYVGADPIPHSSSKFAVLVNELTGC